MSLFRPRSHPTAPPRPSADDANETRLQLSLVSSELDLLRPLARSLAARAEGKEASDAKVSALAAEVSTLRQQLSAAVESAERLGKRAGAAEEEAGAKGARVEGLEKVVRRLGAEAEVSRHSCAPDRSGLRRDPRCVLVALSCDCGLSWREGRASARVFFVMWSLCSVSGREVAARAGECSLGWVSVGTEGRCRRTGALKVRAVLDAGTFSVFLRNAG